MREIYLDNAATTRVDDDIAAAALEAMTGCYGNPSSLHQKGLDAQLLLEKARGKIAAALGCEKSEIVFTSGGTEANNLAVLGAANALRRRGSTIVATAWEHSSVLESCRELGRRGLTVKLASPAKDGRIDIEAVANLVDDDTVLVSCMLVNSEVGAIADIAGLARLVRQKNKTALIHCDAVQGFGKLAFSAAKLNADLLAVSAHKLHAPKGCGALYIKKGARILPDRFGGGQERSLRPGTEPLPAIAAFGAAAKKAAGSLAENLRHVAALREYFVKCAGNFGGMCINSPPDSSPYICNVSLPGWRSEVLLHYLAAKGVYVSSGSACSAGKPSHVLAAMRLAPAVIDGALRVSFCKTNTVDDIDSFFDALKSGVKEIAKT